jgi:hypothetical protein
MKVQLPQLVFRLKGILEGCSFPVVLKVCFLEVSGFIERQGKAKEVER